MTDDLAVAPGRKETATLEGKRGIGDKSPMPLAHDARKPMFDLRHADGAIGSLQLLVQRCYEDFRTLAERVQARLAELEPQLR